MSLERFAPSLAGLMAAFAGWLGLPVWLHSAPEAGLDLSEVFGAAFDTATFAAGVLFTIYIMILTPNGTFVERLFGTRTFALFHRYVSVGILSALFLSAFTIYYLVAGLPEVSTPAPLSIAAIWLGVAAFTTVAIMRVVLVFLTLVGTQARAPKRTITSSPIMP